MLEDEDTDGETLDLALDEENLLAEATGSTSTRFNSEPGAELTINITDSDGTIRSVRKSTYIWMMSEPQIKKAQID